MEAWRPFETALFEQAAKRFIGFIGKNDLQTIRFGIGNHFAAVKRPTLKGIFSTAFKFGEIADPATMYLSDVFTISINIAGNGGMSVPCGLGAQSGMPVGVQLIAPQFKDENMFRAAMALEAAYGKAPWPRTSPTEGD